MTEKKGERPWRQVDIRLCPLNAVPYMLVGNTGDTQLMKMLRGRANEKGLSLNEYGMGKQGKTIEVSTRGRTIRADQRLMSRERVS
jgi:DNA polymerase/3'-5' exonuclease PolX